MATLFKSDGTSRLKPFFIVSIRPDIPECVIYKFGSRLASFGIPDVCFHHNNSSKHTYPKNCYEVLRMRPF